MIPTKRHIIKRGQERWELDFGLDAAGKKRRETFRTEDEAEEGIAGATTSLCSKTEPMRMTNARTQRALPSVRRRFAVLSSQAMSDCSALDKQSKSSSPGRQEPAKTAMYSRTSTGSLNNSESSS
jgi:hypothetical protein